MKMITVLLVFMISVQFVDAQTRSSATKWEPMFVKSSDAVSVSKARQSSDELHLVLEAQQKLDADGKRKILYWGAGSPGYRWYEWMGNLWMTDTSYNGAVANMILSVAMYDAMVAAFNYKNTFQKYRPFEVSKKVKVLVAKPGSSGYPCEYSVAAGVGSAIVGHFFPALADSARKLAREQLESRVAAGVEFPADAEAGYELGVLIARKGIEFTKDYATKERFTGNRKAAPGTWNGSFAYFPMAGKNKTVVLDSASQFRPQAPPDFAREMDELKKYKQTFRSLGNAFYWANATYWGEYLDKKMFEYNLHLDPVRSSWIYAVTAVSIYDGFVACWDAKYTYWGIRPNQYDTTFKPAIMVTPPFPGYPSGHAVVSGVLSEVYAHFFPEDRTMLEKKAKDAAESRFQAGIHFRSDNEVGLDMGKKIGKYIVGKVDQRLFR